MVSAIASMCWCVGFFIAGLLFGPALFSGMPTAGQVFGLSAAGASLIAVALAIDVMRDSR